MEKELTQEQASENEAGTGRLEAFSDGVFAIAITLLVLDLKVPALSGADPGALGRALLDKWPNYLTLFISFATILIMWVYHHRLFQTVRRTETLLLFSNGFLLLLVTVAPFPTALVAAYLTTPAASLVCALYSGFFVFIDLAYNLLIWVVSRQQPEYRSLGSSLSKSWIISLLGMPCYVIGVVVAFWNPYVTLGICCVLWIAWAVTAPRQRVRQRPAELSE
ncbi:MAG TPA: TMEM175 family protein [Ktedonobacteraceae bacterium]|nr:TMEM175 family protein [Ktedonobacteraceae bacterium]